MRRTKEEAAITREQLLEAALPIFREKGYGATTLDDIARKAGTTRGAIYWHFGGKAELFNTMVREQYNRSVADFITIFKMDSAPVEKLRTLLVKMISYPEEDSDYRTMLELVSWKTEAFPELAEGIQEKVQGTREFIKHIAALIQRGIDAGEIRVSPAPEVVATAAVSLIYGITSTWLLDQSAFSLKAYAEEAVDIFIRGITPS
ncbi:MAG TPA: TetR family transcriptional regulator [Ktedonosporobacter sp.]|nr:TetR family transcriptional regulator [Ktedonosporobacter sp.]